MPYVTITPNEHYQEEKCQQQSQPGNINSYPFRIECDDPGIIP